MQWKSSNNLEKESQTILEAKVGCQVLEYHDRMPREKGSCMSQQRSTVPWILRGHRSHRGGGGEAVSQGWYICLWGILKPVMSIYDLRLKSTQSMKGLLTQLNERRCLLPSLKTGVRALKPTQ